MAPVPIMQSRRFLRKASSSNCGAFLSLPHLQNRVPFDSMPNDCRNRCSRVCNHDTDSYHLWQIRCFLLVSDACLLLSQFRNCRIMPYQKCLRCNTLQQLQMFFSHAAISSGVSEAPIPRQAFIRPFQLVRVKDTSNSYSS